MLAVERQRRILEELRERGSVNVTELARDCGVSSVTIRSDLDVLEAQGRLKRTHGGAVPVSEYVVPTVPQRMRRNARAKQAIGRRAAQMVRDGETILLGGGSTTLELLRALEGRRDVTVVTADLNAVQLAEERLPDLNVIVAGGTLDRRYRTLTGPVLAAGLAGLMVDVAFLGADGFDEERGFLVEYAPAAEGDREAMRHARHCVILMDSSKVGAGRSFASFAAPFEVDAVVMDKDPAGIVGDACTTPGHAVEMIEVESGEQVRARAR